MDGIANHFSGQNAQDCRIVHIQFQKFSRVISPDPRRSVPSAWTQTPISAWLASVHIVPDYETTTGSKLPKYRKYAPPKNMNLAATKLPYNIEQEEIGKRRLNFPNDEDS